MLMMMKRRRAEWELDRKCEERRGGRDRDCPDAQLLQSNKTDGRTDRSSIRSVLRTEYLLWSPLIENLLHLFFFLVACSHGWYRGCSTNRFWVGPDDDDAAPLGGCGALHK